MGPVSTLELEISNVEKGLPVWSNKNDAPNQTVDVKHLHGVVDVNDEIYLKNPTSGNLANGSALVEVSTSFQIWRWTSTLNFKYWEDDPMLVSG